MPARVAGLAGTIKAQMLSRYYRESGISFPNDLHHLDDGMKFDPRFLEIAHAVLQDLLDVPGFRVEFQTSDAELRFAMSIQRHVEHLYDDGCTHDPTCPNTAPPAGTELVSSDKDFSQKVERVPFDLDEWERVQKIKRVTGDY